MRILILVVLVAVSVSLSAQNKKMIERASSNTEYVAKAMNMDDSSKQFLYESLLNSYQDAAKRKKGLTDEEKKEVSKEIRKELKMELNKKFSKDEVKQIFALIREKREKDKSDK